MFVLRFDQCLLFFHGVDQDCSDLAVFNAFDFAAIIMVDQKGFEGSNILGSKANVADVARPSIGRGTSAGPLTG